MTWGKAVLIVGSWVVVAVVFCTAIISTGCMAGCVAGFCLLSLVMATVIPAMHVLIMWRMQRRGGGLAHVAIVAGLLALLICVFYFLDVSGLFRPSA
jgi:hypothetical protein